MPKVPSKKARKVASLQKRKADLLEAIATLPLEEAQEQFTALLALRGEIAAAEEEVDTYDCPQCGAEFENSVHIDLLVSAAILYDSKGLPTQWLDFGFKNPQRIKLCGSCVGSWFQNPIDFLTSD